MSLPVLEGCMYPTTQPKRHKADVGCAPSTGGEARRLGGAVSASKGFMQLPYRKSRHQLLSKAPCH